MPNTMAAIVPLSGAVWSSSHHSACSVFDGTAGLNYRLVACPVREDQTYTLREPEQGFF